MIDVLELAKQAGFYTDLAGANDCHIGGRGVVQALAKLVIEAHNKELLECSDEPKIIGYDGIESIIYAYTPDQLAAAVLRERERCAKVCESEYDNWDYERPLRICATAIRKGENT